MYLETILLILKRKGSVRSVDIVHELDYVKSSVSRAVNLLVEKGYIVMDAGEGIILTESGQKKATYIYERHQTLTDVLMRIGASQELAEENACRIEHVVTDEMFDIIKDFVSKKQL